MQSKDIVYMVPILDRTIVRRCLFMILLLDLSNLSLDIRVYQKRKAVFSFRTYADKLRSELEYQHILATFLEMEHLSIQDFDGAILSSVVPSLTNRIRNATTMLLKKQCLVLNRTLKTGLAIRMDNPSEVGTDLIAEALGGVNDYQRDTLIVDMSTVVSFVVVTKRKEFVGGSLFPGLMTSSSLMFNSNAQLMDIEFEKPKRMLGKSTKESMNNGILNGYACLIEEFSRRIEIEHGSSLFKVLTGPDASLVRSLLTDMTYNPDIVFDGLYDIYMKNN